MGWLSAIGMVMAILPGPLASASGAPTTPWAGTLYYTTYQNQGTCTANCTPNVFKVSWNYNGSSSFTLGTSATVATLAGADGIVFTPGGQNVLIGGQHSGRVYEISPTTGTVESSVYTGTNNAFHLTMDPSGKAVWAFGNAGDDPGRASVIGLGATLTPGVITPITGGDTVVTQFAFVPNSTTAFYTSSNEYGNGSFGTVSPGLVGSNGYPSSWTASRLLPNLPAAHGIVYDPFTGDLILAGANEIAQINPSNPSAVLSSYTPPNNARFDQVVVDGQGHVFVADNLGNVYFIDYSQSKRIGASGNYVAAVPLTPQLDDIALQPAPPSTCGANAPKGSGNSGSGNSGDPDHNGDVNSNNHNGQGEDNGSSGSMKQGYSSNGNTGGSGCACGSGSSGSGNSGSGNSGDPDHNGDVNSNNHNGQGEDNGSSGSMKQGYSSNGNTGGSSCGACGVGSSGNGSTGDPDHNGDVNSNNHNGQGEDNGSSGSMKQGYSSNGNTGGSGCGSCGSTGDPDHNGDVSSNNHNGQGEDNGSSGNAKQGSWSNGNSNSGMGSGKSSSCSMQTDGTGR